MKIFSVLIASVLTMGLASAQPQPTPTGPGFALFYDGQNDYATANPGGILRSSVFTVECWARSFGGTPRTILSQGRVGNAFYIGVNSNNVTLGEGWKVTSIPFPEFAWHHFAVVAIGFDTLFYLDGVLMTNLGGLLPPPDATELRFGRHFESQARYWNGEIDEVRIWDVPRSGAELAQNMYRSLSGTEPGLRAYWRFDEGSGNASTDSTFFGNDVDLENGPRRPTWISSSFPFVPGVITSNAISLTATSATLAGVVFPNGAATTAFFEWGPTSSYGNATQPTDLGGNGGFPVYSTISGLTAETTYQCRLVASNALGLSFGTNRSFATHSTNANLSGLSLSTGNLTPAFQSNVISYTAFVNDNLGSIRITATRAQPNATIQARINGGGFTTIFSGSPSSPFLLNVGANALEIRVTAQDGITTKSYTVNINWTPPPPFAHAQQPGPVTLSSARLNGMGSPNGPSATAWFEWGTTTNYGQTTVPVSIGAGSRVARVSATISGLSTLRLYHCRLVVSTVSGVAFSSDRTFFAGGFVAAWGVDNYGEVTPPVKYQNAVAVAAGSEHSLALLTDGAVAAWGRNHQLQIAVPSGLNDVVSIACGYNHSLAVQSGGTVVAWGQNVSGESTVPADLTNAIAASAGIEHTIALRSNGIVIAWGSNASGQTNIPPGLSNVVAIASGFNHNMALRDDGTVFAWGDSSNGQTTVPSGLSNVVAIACGYFSGHALRKDGTVVSWGATAAPMLTSNLTAIAAGSGSFVGVKDDTRVQVFGSGAQTNVTVGLHSVAALVSGNDHTLAIGLLANYFAGREPITGTNISFQTSNADADAEFPDEPAHSNFGNSSGDSPHFSMWYSWTAPFSGGTVIQVVTNGSASYRNPALAVYTGTVLSSLVKVADNASFFGRARIAFTALAGQTYQVAVAGFVDQGQGPALFTLQLSPPPANDLFGNAAIISEDYFVTSGSFLGASRESFEPSHNAPAFKETLWWSWTAPTIPGVSNIPVRLTADAVSFPPEIGVYLGSSVASLMPVATVSQTNGLANGRFSMTRMASFNAVTGATYRIALAGMQHSPAGNVISPRFGNYRFQLNSRPLSLGTTNFGTFNPGDNSRTFTGTVRVANLGAGPSKALRVRTFTAQGVSVNGVDLGYTQASQFFQRTNVLAALAMGASAQFSVTGSLAPAVTNTVPAGTGIGYGAFAQLEEEILPGVWSSADQVLIGFDDWPALNTDPGPGGGVIRLDAYGATTANNRLKSVSILGMLSVTEGNSMSYTGRAAFYSGSATNFTIAPWFLTNAASGLSNRLLLTTNGVLTVGNITNSGVVGLGIPYSYVTYSNVSVTNIFVTNLPGAALSELHEVGNRSLALTVTGVPSRSNVVEFATNLSPSTTVWMPLLTNAPISGVFTFTNQVPTNVPQRFFRARELN